MPDLKPVRWLDEKLRFLDLRLHRTCCGYLKPLGIDRHSPGFVLFPPVVCFTIVAGTAEWDMRLAYAATSAAIVFFLVLGLARLSRKNSVNWDMAVHVVLIATVAGVVWFAGTDEYRENALYRHLLVPIAWLISAGLALAAGLADWLFRDLIDATHYPDYLRQTELFQSYGPDRTATGGRILAAALTAPLRGPLQFLWLPAAVAIVSLPALLWQSTIGAAALSYVALVVAGIDDRFDVMWRLFQRAMFRGGALVVSVLVIVFALARLVSVSYVTTVLDSAAAQAILFLIASLYVMSWWADYWIARLLSQKILEFIAGGAVSGASIDYPILQTHTSVPASDRVLQIHGASKFLALREIGPNDLRFQAHTADSLIGLLADSGAPGGKATPLPSQIRARSNTYGALVSMFLMLAGGLGVWLLHEGYQSPELRATARKTATADLNGLLWDDTRQNEGRPVIVLAASGGGTRAALYTASVLRALWKENAARDIALGSGISGGGAALAYFASQRLVLAQATTEDPWDQYITTMKQPFIQDVLTRATEWRMIGPGRLGMLLAESFSRRWNLPERRHTLGAVNDMGLILNTSLAGHFDSTDAENRKPGDRLIDLERKNRRATRSELAGGRLILTNLKLNQSIEIPTVEGKSSHDLPIVVNDPDTPLEIAAALNANFPPVFPDAAVDIDQDTRYWVTDGGVIDNRGMETLLYTLRQALEQRKERLPRVVVLIADASGYSPLFSQDRGSAVALSAGSKMASQLSSELLASVLRLYCSAKQPDDFGFAYLFMPDELRNSGSFGTHWMLQPRINVQHEHHPGETSEVTLSGEDMVQVLKYLYTDETPLSLSAAATTVLEWSRAARSPWSAFIAGLKRGGTLPKSGLGSCSEGAK